MVWYFSATGNTRYVANLLAKELGDEAVSITEKQSDINVPVICFPVHGWRVPKIVEKFLKARTFNPVEGSMYVVFTCGDDCGKAIEWLRKITDPLGVSIAGAFSIQMPESYVGLPFMDVDNKRREQEKIAAARHSVQHIADVIRKNKRGVYEVHEGSFARIKSEIIGGFFHNVLITDKTFRVDRRSCIGCGRCVEVCQVDNMLLNKAKQPEWRHTDRCLTCLACYHVCPRHAISFNGMTSRKGQYFLKNYN